MTTALRLPCPRCKRVLETHAWHDDRSGECRQCATPFDFISYPALNAEQERISTDTVVLDGESVCFFHAENRAAAVCEQCGRLLCPVCAVPYMGKKMCPACISAASRPDKADIVAVRSRMLWDSLALLIAVGPLVLVFTVFLTIVTAPVALGVVIYGWNKPNSLVRRGSRWRLIVAGIVALIEIGVWVFLVVR